ncbi:MAG TPA: type II toxin-antitoxin system PrlF family antitoxin [Methylocystis sp.]|nr:type II toxin-antitoxin system PrlF family antitoxin [Methylocystis sp.]
MASVGEVLRIPATITDRGQTTVPAAIRKMLKLGKRGKVEFRGMADGTVVIARVADENEITGDDPALANFLSFLAKDIAQAPHQIRPVSRDLVARGKALVEEVEVDLESPLPDDDG